MILMFLGGAVWARAQRPFPRGLEPVISGSDIGFRIVSRKGSTAIGTFVIRVNGEWLTAESTAIVKPAGR